MQLINKYFIDECELNQINVIFKTKTFLTTLYVSWNLYLKRKNCQLYEEHLDPKFVK